MRQAPHNLIAAGVVVLTLVLGAAILLALRAPLLGLGLEAEANALRVTSIATDSPNRDRLVLDSRITRLAGLTPEADLLIDDPDQIGEWARFNALLDALDRLHAAAATGAIPAMVDGEPVVLAARSRTLADLPMLFWIQVAAGAAGFLIALGVFAFKPREAGAVHFVLMGIGLLITVSAHAVFSTRELAFEGALLGWLSRINNLGALVFVAALAALLWVYPRPLSNAVPVPIVMYVTSLAAWLAIAFQVLPATNQLYVVVLAMACVSFLLAALQWRACRSRPVERAALKWFLLAILLGTGIFTIMGLLPPVLGLADIVSVELRIAAAMLLVLSIFVGIMLGITRYRLFELDRWWFTAWFWFLGGLAVIVLDLVLVLALGMTQLGAMSLALALVGWLYFPLRQWLWSRAIPSGPRNEQMSSWLRELASATDAQSLKMTLRSVLQQAFAPLQLLETAGDDQVRIEDNGRTLVMPDITSGDALLLNHADNGARLFTRSDIHSAEALVATTRLLREAMQEREQQVLAERQRIRRDLHDDLGAKLLTLVYRTDGETRQLARSAISDMRDILTALDAAPMPLEEALANWHAEAQQRAESHAFALEWQDHGIPAGIMLSTREHTNLGRILREAISNAVRHAATPAIAVVFALQDGVLSISLSNRSQHCDASPDQWKPGLGIGQIRRRVADLGGTVRWDKTLDGHRMWMTVPLGSVRAS